MSKEVKRYSPDTNGRMREWPDGDYATWDDYDELAAENDRLRTKNDRMARERPARQALSIQLIDEARGLLAERDRLREALNYSCKSLCKVTSSDGSGHADIALAALRLAGVGADEREALVEDWKANVQWRIDRAALQGAQP